MPLKKDKYSFLQRIQRSWLMDFTPVGRALVIGLMLALMIGSTSTQADTIVLMCFFICFGFIGLVINGIMRPKVDLKHAIPKRSVAGEVIPFSITAKNIAKSTARDVVVQAGDLLDFCKIEPEKQLVDIIPPGKKQEFRFNIKFKRRGSYTFPGFRVDTAYPFGFNLLGRYISQETSLLVYPKFLPIANLHIPTGRRYQPGGVALVSKLGDSTEYIGNREYQVGDKLRDIDWRSWSRLGDPFVREYQEEYFCRVALILDTNLGKKINSLKKEDFEASLSLAATISDYLSHQEYLVDIFAAGPQIYIMEAGRSLAYFDQILEVLACLEPCNENPFEIIEPVIAQRIANLTTVIVILLDMDEARRQFLEDLSLKGIGLKVLVCNSKITPSDIIVNRKTADLQWLTAAQINEGLDSL